MGASALYLQHVLWATNARLSLSWLATIWRVGAPLEGGSMMVFTAMLVQAGDAHLAAHVIVVRVISVSFLPGFALGEVARRRACWWALTADIVFLAVAALWRLQGDRCLSAWLWPRRWVLPS